MISFLYYEKRAEGPKGAPDATPATIHARRRAPRSLAALPEGYKNEIIDHAGPSRSAVPADATPFGRSGRGWIVLAFGGRMGPGGK